MGNGKNSRALLKSILIIALYFIWPYVINATVGSLNIGDNLKIILKFISNALLLLIVVGVYFKTLHEDFIAIKKSKKVLLTSLKYFLLGLGAYILLNTLIFIFLPNIRQENADILVNMFKQIPILFVLNTLIYYPIVEEIVFKKTIRDIIDSKWLFIIISGIANAFFNIALSTTTGITLVYLIPGTIFSMTFSYIYYETDNLDIAIFYRMVYNLIPSVTAFISTAVIMMR